MFLQLSIPVESNLEGFYEILFRKSILRSLLADLLPSRLFSGCFPGVLFFFFLEQQVDHQKPHADGDRGIRHVERGPVVAPPVNVDEIDHFA